MKKKRSAKTETMEDDLDVSGLTKSQMPMVKVSRGRFNDYRSGGLCPNADPKLVDLILSVLRQEVEIHNVEPARENIEWAVTLFFRNKRIDDKEGLFRSSMKTRELSVFVERVSQSLNRNDDYHATEVLKHIDRCEQFDSKTVRRVIAVLNQACINVDSRSTPIATRPPDVAIDKAASHFIEAWAKISKTLKKSATDHKIAGTDTVRTIPNRDFTFNYTSSDHCGQEVFVSRGMRFVQLAFAILDPAIELSRIRTAAAKVSTDRSSTKSLSKTRDKKQD